MGTKHQACGQLNGDHDVVDQLCTRYGWSLLERDELVQRMQKRLQTGQATDNARAAIWVYGDALYAACSGVEGIARREQGYRELHRWLYAVAYYRYRDVAEEAAQQALVLTYTAIERCRLKGMFLMFAVLQLRNAARQLGHTDPAQKSTEQCH